MIEISDLVKKYGDHMAVDHLSLTVEPGKIYGLLGPNGAGKSTTMNIVTGYIGADGGTVKINGYDIFAQPEEAKKCIGYLPEIPPLYVDMTVYEYLKFVAELKKLDRKKRKEMIADVMEQFGRIDILVNNAGITKDGLIMRMSEEDFTNVVDVNLKGTFHCIRFASRQMMKQRSGRIINMSSVVGISGNAGQINYAASKAGVIGMTKSAAKELASRGITVNAIAPGYIETDMTNVLSDKVKEETMKQIPLGRLGQTGDIAAAAAFLASDEAGYITGQVLAVDGGMAI